MGRVIARAVLSVTDPGNKSVHDRAEKSVTLLQNNDVTHRDKKRCACGCGRELVGRKKTYDATCRKRLSRNKFNVPKT